MAAPLSLATPCCIYSHELCAGFSVYPSHGIWTLRKYLEILNACDADEVLNGVYQAPCSEGGFAWEGTDESVRLYLRNVRSPIEDIEICKSVMPPSIRTYGACEFFGFRRAPARAWHQLQFTDEELDEQSDIDESYRRGKHALPCIRCRSKFNPPLEKVVRLMQLFEAQGHIILQTEGFQTLYDRSIRITPKKYHSIVRVDEIKRLPGCTTMW